MILKKSACLFFFALGSFAGYGQVENIDSSRDIRNYYMDFSVSEITAFSLLNTEPSSISRPGTVKEFAGSLGSYLTKDGSIKPGLALEWAPLKTFCRHRYNWENDNFQIRNFTFSAATIADTVIDDNVLLSTAFRFAPIDKRNPLSTKDGREGLNLVIIQYIKSMEKEDEKYNVLKSSYLNYVDALNEEFDASIENNPEMKRLDSVFYSIFDMGNSNANKIFFKAHFRDTLSALSFSAVVGKMNFLIDSTGLRNLDFFEENKTEINSMVDKAAQLFMASLLQFVDSPLFHPLSFKTSLLAYKENYKKTHWNKMAFEIGGGSVFNVPNGKLRMLDQNYSSGYISFALPFACEKEAPDHKKIYNWLRNKSQLVLLAKYQAFMNPDSLQFNTFFAGGRILMGDYDKRISFEVGYMFQENKASNVSFSGVQYAIGGDFKVSDGNWLEVALGGQVIEGSGTINLLPKFSYRHAFNNESRFFK